MGLFNNNIEIDLENPFKNDKLQREAEVKSLTSLFEVIDNQMVLAINSEWGTGKSSFLRMWNQYIKNEGYNTVFFNAWENDFVDDPFIAFVNEINNNLSCNNKTKGFLQKAKDAGLALVKHTPQIASTIIKNKTGFDTDEFISNEDIKQFISDKIDNYNDNKNTINIFKKELEEISNAEFEENKKPMIIFVDELDRCRPDYAISLLERIKHFFNVQNIIFILGIDKEALSNSIRVIYGEQTDINGYLTRFIDIEYKLKESNREIFIKYLLDRYKFQDIFNSRICFENVVSVERDIKEFTKIIISAMIGFKLSLRDIEKVIVQIYMLLKANFKDYIYPYPLILLLVIKRINKDMYNKIKSNQIFYMQFENIIADYNTETAKWIESNDSSMFKAYSIWLLNDVDEINKLKKYVEEASQKNSYDDKNVRCLELYNWIVSNKGYPMTFYDYNGIKNHLCRMVELYDDFNIVKTN